MSNPIYLAMNGAKTSLLAQAVNSNNLANVTTPGFRSDLYHAMSVNVIDNNVKGYAFAVNDKPAPDFTPGTIMQTNRSLDAAIVNKGWFAIQLPDGREVYSRAGNFNVGANGQLYDGAGHPVLGNGGPIALPPSQQIQIANDGTISVIPQGSNTPATVERLKLVNPPEEDLVRDESGYFILANNEPAVPDPAVRIESGALEGSNVNAAESMVTIIALARQFEMQMKVLQQTSEADSVAAQLLQ